jgi:diketogulonate reductase-like aldo/keto reductase
MPTIQKLNTGAPIPAIGFGTWQDKEEQEGAVVEALKAGVCSTIPGHPLRKGKL